MARNKRLDDLEFNCGQAWEFDEVADHYGENNDKVKKFLKKYCEDNTIKNSTHKDVYKLIEKEFGYAIPV